MTRPLHGFGVPAGDATLPDLSPSSDRLPALLQARGAVPLLHPLTRTLPAGDEGPLRTAVAGIAGYDWLVVTSGRAVPPLRAALAAAGIEPAAVRAAGVRVCAVGPATSEALAGAGLPADLLPDRFEAGGVVEALAGATPLAGLRVLFPRAEEGRDLIPRELQAAGATVDMVPAYRTVPYEEGARALAAGIAAGEVDAVLFTAPSAVRSFAAAWGGRGPLPPGTGIVAIGPSTAEALGEVGLPAAGVADPHTLDGLVAALERWAAGRGSG